MEWFYAKDGKQEGPVDLATLQEKLLSGEVLPTDLIWKEGMAEWLPADKVPEVAPGATSQAPASPVEAPAPEAPVAGGSPSPAGSPVGTGSPMAAGSPVAAPAATSGLAIASLVCGIISLIACYVNALFALPAIICGHIAVKKIKESDGTLGGRGMAIAGLVMGYVGLIFQVVTIVAIMFFYTKAVETQQDMQQQIEMQIEMQNEAMERAQEGVPSQP